MHVCYIIYMNLVYFIIFSLFIFLASLLGGKKYRTTTLYALAIGGIVNANFFHAGNHPIDCFNLPFGIDSIIYTLFVYCVIVMFIQFGKKDAYLLSFSSIVAIILSALIEFITKILSNGYSVIYLNTLINFVVSALASLIAIYITFKILDLLKNKTNKYILLIVSLFLCLIINTIIYYPIITVINNTPSNIGILLLTSIIGKLIAILSALLAFFLMCIYDKKH